MRVIASLFVFALAVFAAPGRAIELPDMGESSATVISPEEEMQLGGALMTQLRRSGKLLEDAELQNYIDSLGFRLLSQSDAASQSFTFFLVNDPTVNAFALPGGYVGIHAGLLNATRSEHELASVLAHEIAHVTQRHIARSFEKASELNLPLTAAVIAAILLGSKDPQIAEAAVAASVASSTQMQLDFTRANEQEADRVGMQLLASAQFDPRGMPSFFERLEQEGRYYGSGAPEFLRTHPVTTSRIADSRNRAEQYPSAPSAPGDGYFLAKARLRVLTHSDPKALAEKIAEEIKSGSYESKAAARYSHALSLLKAGDAAKAAEEFDKLAKADGTRLSYILGQAAAYEAAGRASTAGELYRSALQIYPGNRLLSLNYARFLVDRDAPKEAAALLRKLAGERGDAEVFQLLGRAESALGNAPASHLALAEYYRHTGDPYSAITQLEMAKRLEGVDFYHASRIDALLDELKRSLPPPPKNASEPHPEHNVFPSQHHH